ncbi:MAG: metal-dependent transcriptional regulator [Acidobacteriia bacterium]|nr:metal-dependent transcriptional regulator [Terriglobia bacterium]
MITHQMEEVLEAIWTAEERGDTHREKVAAMAVLPLEQTLLDSLVDAGWILSDATHLNFTPEGRGRAREIIRRHRLAERLVMDVLGVDIQEAEDSACEFEHSLALGLADSICTLLGHPNRCPHGRAIPEGRCCQQAQSGVTAVVFPLTALSLGASGRIAYINTRNFPRIQKLSAFGVTPGVTVRLFQKSPSYVLQCEETQIALEEEIAREIFVRRAE